MNKICPKCGSDNTEPIQGSKDRTALLIAAIFMFLLPCVYMYYGKSWGVQSTALDIIAGIVFISSLVIVFTYDRIHANYKCKDCGKKFRRV